MKKIFFLILILFSIKIFAEEKTAFFIPPKNWVILNPKIYTKYIKVIFAKNEKTICRPTIILSMQETDLSLDDYTNKAKKEHEIDPNITYKILGPLDLLNGKAILSEVCKTVNTIDYKILQLILIKDCIAYVLTAASKKGDIVDNYKIFTDSFKTFELLDDLFSKVSIKSKKNLLASKYKSLIASSKKLDEKQNTKNLVSFEKYLDKNYPNEGKYFTMLVVEKALKEIKDFKK